MDVHTSIILRSYWFLVVSYSKGKMDYDLGEDIRLYLSEGVRGMWLVGMFFV